MVFINDSSLSLSPVLSPIWDQLLLRLNLWVVCLAAIFPKFFKKLFASRLLCDSSPPDWHYLYNVSVEHPRCLRVWAVLPALYCTQWRWPRCPRRPRQRGGKAGIMAELAMECGNNGIPASGSASFLKYPTAALMGRRHPGCTQAAPCTLSEGSQA